MNYKNLPQSTVVVEKVNITTLMVTGISGFVIGAVFIALLLQPNLNDISLEEHNLLINQSHDQGVYEISEYVMATNKLPIFIEVDGETMLSHEVNVEISE